MRLVGVDGQSLELRIVGYQFPDEASAEFDSNWLIVQATIGHPRGEWSFRDPCLLTYEVASLAQWIDDLAIGRSLGRELSFVEPNLSFLPVASPGGDRVRVHFELEARPPWDRRDIVGDRDCFVELLATPADLVAAAADLRSQLVAYPQRAQL